MTHSTMWWSFVKISLTLWPEGNKQTDRQNNKIDLPTNLENRRFFKNKKKKISKILKKKIKKKNWVWLYDECDDLDKGYCVLNVEYSSPRNHPGK